MVPGYFPVLIFLFINCSKLSYASRVTLVQQQACNYVSATKEVLCKCRDEDTRAYIGVRMQGFVMKSGQEVSFVHAEFLKRTLVSLQPNIEFIYMIRAIYFQILSLVVQSCPDLIISLDLRGLNLSKVQTVFRNCETLRIESINLDKRNAVKEVLRMEFYQIKSLTISGVQVESKIKVIMLLT
jgi:predicted nucleic acid-binding Zn finger protein